MKPKPEIWWTWQTRRNGSLMLYLGCEKLKYRLLDQNQRLLANYEPVQVSVTPAERKRRARP